MTPTDGPLYQTRENLTIQDEEESVPVNFVCPASPQKPHNAVQFVRGKSIKQPSKPVTVSAQVNGSTRQRTRPVSGIKKDTTYTQSTRPPSRLGAMTPYERSSTPCTPSLLVAKPAHTIVPKSPRPPSARYRQVQVADSVSVQAAQRFNSDTSDVDQFAEVHHVIRIPTRTYRTSIRGVRNAQTTRTVSERRAFDSVPKKTEPVKSCLVTRNRRSSCSSISDHDNQPFCDKSSVNASSAATVTATYGINRQTTLVCEDRVPEGNADTAQPGRLLKRNQISWNLGSIKKFFNRRDKTGHEPPIHDQITRDYAEVTMDLEKPSPKKYTTTMKLKDGLPKNVVGPAIRQTLLTPSVDHLTRRSSIRSVRR
ncbi:hypothetical protein FGIG_04139 [Fasciola gigantica]|uniref:Uncharacterized protein n=1 Tax=Fasciola gigantica TaxID=46835 RepID=A0A504YSE7_FASGI|nr:hypothetical protein FGIG_04139 [Fasciola gigantica]